MEKDAFNAATAERIEGSKESHVSDVHPTFEAHYL